MTKFIADFLFGLGLFFGGLILLNKSITSTKNSLCFKKNNGIIWLLFGIISSAITQSSSAITSMTVQVVDKKIISKKTGYFVVMGTNIGTTLTCYIISFDSEILILILSILFFLSIIFIVIFHENKRKLFIILASIFLIILSLKFINRKVLMLSDNIDISFYKKANPLLLLFISTFTTAVFQSSTLTASVTITLSKIGLIDLNSALLMIIGANVGTCSTALLSSFGKSPSARSISIFNLLFNVIGTILHINLISLGGYVFLKNLSVSITTKIALFHTIFNMTTALIIVICFGVKRLLQDYRNKRLVIT